MKCSKIKSKRKLQLCIFVFILTLFIPVCMGQSIFKAGAYSFNVTPPPKILCDRIVHDSLYAKSLVLDNGIIKIVFVIVDNQGIPQYICDEAKREISITTDIPISNIVIAATHTHTGESAGNAPINLNKDGKLTDYQKILINGIVESVKRANLNIVESKIGWGSIDKAEFVFNRRWYMKSPVINPFGLMDSVKTNPGFNTQELLKPAGPTDTEIFFIAVKSITNEPIAVLANYSLHYVGEGAKNDISSDYYGKFAEYLSVLLQSPKKDTHFVGIMTNGTSGDINSINYAVEKNNFGPYEKINIIAQDIAIKVAEKYQNIQFYSWVSLNVVNLHLILKSRIPSAETLKNVKKINQNQSDEILYNSQEKKYAGRIARFSNLYPKRILIPLQAIQIGNIGISTIPFEVFAETGLEIKNKNPFENSFTISIANGHWGYLPTLEQHKKGGYETWITVSRVQEDASNIIVDQLLKQFYTLK